MSKEYKVIFHIDEMDQWKIVMNNAENALNDFTKNDLNIKIEVLANSNAVTYYDSKNTEDINCSKFKKLTEQGVNFLACNHSLHSNNLSAKDLYPTVKIVPAGVSELIKRQAEGYAYIKP